MRDNIEGETGPCNGTMALKLQFGFELGGWAYLDLTLRVDVWMSKRSQGPIYSG